MFWPRTINLAGKRVHQCGKQTAVCCKVNLRRAYEHAQHTPACSAGHNELRKAGGSDEEVKPSSERGQQRPCVEVKTREEDHKECGYTANEYPPASMCKNSKGFIFSLAVPARQPFSKCCTANNTIHRFFERSIGAQLRQHKCVREFLLWTIAPIQTVWAHAADADEELNHKVDGEDEVHHTHGLCQAFRHQVPAPTDVVHSSKLGTQQQAQQAAARIDYST
eukprot:1141337-Pelagomonas_calceolata.AAC.5